MIKRNIAQTSLYVDHELVSVILDNGVCVVGDLEPIEHIEAYENNVPLKEDWQRIMSFTPKMILYAHANEKVIP